MANYLVRNGSRFYFSHSFAYCPLQDIMKLHARGSVDGIAKYTPADGKIYLKMLHCTTSVAMLNWMDCWQRISTQDMK
jgi:hypothetical protein